MFYKLWFTIVDEISNMAPLLLFLTFWAVFFPENGAPRGDCVLGKGKALLLLVNMFYSWKICCDCRRKKLIIRAEEKIITPGRYFIGCSKSFDQNITPPLVCLCKYVFVATSEARVAEKPFTDSQPLSCVYSQPRDSGIKTSHLSGSAAR